MLINGEKQKAAKAPKSAQDVLVPIGPKSDPIELVKRSDIDEYLTPELFRQYQIFERFEMGFGMPGNRAWDEQPIFIMEILETLRAEYNKIRPAEAHR